MIRTNLSTRPFYNEGTVRLWFLALGIIVVLATAFNLTRLIQYSRSDTELATQASSDEGRTAELRAQAAKLRASVDTKQIETASLEARRANELIDRRTFSWTDLFNLFEATLPPDVRITSIRPRIEDNRRIVLTLTVLARDVDDVDRFMESLEMTGRVKGLLTRDERVNEQGQLESVLETDYVTSKDREAVNELFNRVLTEKRSMVLPLVIGLAANVAAYALVVRPRGVKSAGAANRAAAAATALRSAENELATARALVDGKSRADEELNAFYQKVLPVDLVAARRMTYASLPALARRTKVRYEQRRTTIEDPEKDAQLGHLTIRMVLAGDYESIRDFIFELESAPEFVIIDDVTLVESDEAEQTLTIDLSTYFKLRPNGA